MKSNFLGIGSEEIIRAKSKKPFLKKEKNNLANKSKKEEKADESID